MIVRRFLAWSETAPASLRAEGASALARAYLAAGLPSDEDGEAVVALTALLDDPSPLVRRALAQVLADAPRAPHHIVAALAVDQSDIAAIVLARSRVLADAELIDCAAIGDVFAQSAIAIRPGLSAPVAAALAEVGAREALIALAVNPRADLPEFSMRRMIERLGHDGEVREALLSRPDLPPAVRHDLVVATAEALSDFVTGCAWLSEARTRRVTDDARERAIVTIGAGTDYAGLRALVGHLRASGVLTAGLLLRSVLSGDLVFFEATLAELTRAPPVRIAGMVREVEGAGFGALYKKAGMPIALLPIFRAAVAAAREFGDGLQAGAGSRLSARLIGRVLAECGQSEDGRTHRLLARLRRLEAEALRDEARQVATDMMRIGHEESAFGPPEIIGDTDRFVIGPPPVGALTDYGYVDDEAMRAAA